ncbi:DEAD/DEAH box helicase [Winogradskyella sp.]|uniref:DEAD/DEAH box helicase n=1 Tax=Winogradskyella sp. TaxID=1883156 RepID=UPI00262DF195|nr:DEAD/DEAH box helicase [Winogradskyella sp.]
MIKLSYEENSIIIVENDNNNGGVFSNTIHTLFFKGTLQGIFEEEEKKWIIKPKGNLSNVFENLINHLKKYKIEYLLDSKLSKYLQEKENLDDRFRDIINKGFEFKCNQNNMDLGSLKNKIRKYLVRDPKPHQLKSIYHLDTVENGAVFSVPGSGKTTVVLSYFGLLKAARIADKILVIGPSSCFAPWEEEYFSCFGKKPNALRLSGITKKERSSNYLEAPNYELLLTTYHTAANDIKDLAVIMSSRDYLLVLDESHYIKKPGGGKLVDGVLAIANYAKRRVILTGTPMPNNFIDLWSQFTFLWPSNYPLGKLISYQKMIKGQSQDSTSDKVSRKIGGLFFRVTKANLNLSKPEFNIISSNMGTLQEKIYLGIATKYLSDLKLAKDDKDTLRHYRSSCAIRLLQVAVNPSLLMKDCYEFGVGKMAADDLPLRDVIREYSRYETPSKILKCIDLTNSIIEEGRKVIIWTTFIHNLLMLENLFKENGSVAIYGDVPYSSKDKEDITREKLIERFKNDKDCKVLIANPAACAESISLHNICSDAIYTDRSYNCAHYVQSLDRIHRVGLKEGIEVNYYLLMSTGSIDEKISDNLENKIARMNALLDSENVKPTPDYWLKEGFDDESDNLQFIEDHLQEILQ